LAVRLDTSHGLATVTDDPAGRLYHILAWAGLRGKDCENGPEGSSFTDKPLVHVGRLRALRRRDGAKAAGARPMATQGFTLEDARVYPCTRKGFFTYRLNL